MTGLITVVHIGACFFLVLMILLQQSKGDGMGSAFGGGSSQSVLGSSAGNILTKITTFLAIVFMITSLSLAYISSQTSTDSILKDAPSSQAPISAPEEATESMDVTETIEENQTDAE